MAKPILVKGTDARIFQPTESKPYWRITYLDRATGKLRHASGGKSYEAAEAKARKLSGEFVEGWKTGGQAPTVNEAVELWLAAKRSDWAGRTYQHNNSLAKKLTALYGTRSINRISPADIAKVEVAGLVRNECERIRTMVRGSSATARTGSMSKSRHWRGLSLSPAPPPPSAAPGWSVEIFRVVSSSQLSSSLRTTRSRSGPSMTRKPRDSTASQARSAEAPERQGWLQGSGSRMRAQTSTATDFPRSSQTTNGASDS